MQSFDPNQVVPKLYDKFQKGNIPLVEMICRQLLDEGVRHPAIFTLLGCVANRIGMWDFARFYLEQALQLDPKFDAAQRMIGVLANSQLDQSADLAVAPNRKGKKFLLIKAWGYGFWSDMDHVLGQLLVAELTDRIPIVHWGKNSLFGSGHDNAFGYYFEPVSEYSLADLANSALSFFPPKWNAGNLLEENLNKWSGTYSRFSSLYALNRSEDVVVSDFYTHVLELLPWIREGHPYYGLDIEVIYQKLFSKYVRLRPHLTEKIDVFRGEQLLGRRWLAVHVRGSDKLKESNDLVEINKKYHAQIEYIRRDDPELSLYLLTDSESILEEYRGRYGSELLCTNCLRTATEKGVHYSGHSGRQLGEEVVIDTYLAASCARFLGNGRSNVSTSVQHIKSWESDKYKLIGNNFLREHDFFLHSW